MTVGPKCGIKIKSYEFGQQRATITNQSISVKSYVASYRII